MQAMQLSLELPDVRGKRFDAESFMWARMVMRIDYLQKLAAASTSVEHAKMVW